jgi:hypothetical protein
VDSTDAVIVFANIATLARIDIGAGGPFVPEEVPDSAGDGTSAVASALAAPSSADRASLPLSSAPAAGTPPDTRPIARQLAQPIDGHDPRADVKLNDDEADDVWGLDDDLLDALVARTASGG